MIHTLPDVRNTSSRFSINSEAFASELLEILKKCNAYFLAHKKRWLNADCSHYKSNDIVLQYHNFIESYLMTYPSLPCKKNAGICTSLSVSSWTISIILSILFLSWSIIITAWAPIDSAYRALETNEHSLENKFKKQLKFNCVCPLYIHCKQDLLS